MTRACDEAQLSAADIQYINSHGTGTPLNDVAEGMAIQRWAGEHVSKLMVSSTKANIGHLLGGAGAIEAIAAIKAMVTA
jgi:3-oxoacyl-[acyl-carrier-protein] synthase II